MYDKLIFPKRHLIMQKSKRIIELGYLKFLIKIKNQIVLYYDDCHFEKKPH